MKYLLPLIILIFAFSVFGQAPKAPSGWRFPSTKDVKGNWKTFKKELPTPYKIRGDFNNDKLIDEVWLLLPTTGKGFGLFAFLKQSDNTFRSIQLDNDGSADAQNMYVDIANPERYDTACGKGYWDCAENEPAVLELKTKGIAYGIFESALSIFYWDKQTKSFNKVGISD